MAEDLDALYTQTINEQREYLAKLQQGFNEHCDAITAESEARLAKNPETDMESRQQIFEDQKRKLDAAISHLRNEIDTSGRETRKKLEEINNRREEEKIHDLEKMMDQVG